MQRMRRSVITSARLITEGLQDRRERYRCAMVTLTYAPVREWSPLHITEFLKRVREYLCRQGHKLRYDWTLELTKAGRPHYHVLIWLPRGVSLPKPDKRGWWTQGSSRIEWARNAVGYIAKYASKGGDGDRLPKGARLHGHGGLEKGERLELRWWMLPRWVRDVWGPEHEPMRVPRGYRSKLTGEVLQTPYRIVWRSRDWRRVEYEKRDAVGERPVADAPTHSAGFGYQMHGVQGVRPPPLKNPLPHELIRAGVKVAKGTG